MSLLLDPGHPAELILEGGWRAPVVIVEATADVAVVRPASGGLRLPDRLDWAAAALEWTTPDGRIGRNGVLVAGDDGELRLEPFGQQAFEQRRKHERVPAAITAEVSVNGRTFDATTLDVSAGGMLLDGADDLDAHGEISFTLHLGDREITGHGAIVRDTGNGTRAVRFDALHGEEDQVSLARWLDAHMHAVA